MAGLLATPAVAQGNFVPPQQQDSGLVGLATGQTARFSVLYPGIPAPVAQVGVLITLIIDDDQGRTLVSQDFALTGAIGKGISWLSKLCWRSLKTRIRLDLRLTRIDPFSLMTSSGTAEDGG
jgi:hypothetical protein